MELKDLLGENYREGMSVEDIEQALSGIKTIPGTVSKSVFDKTASDLSAQNKAVRKLQADGEQAKADFDATVKTMQDEINTLKRQNMIGENTAKYMRLGYSEDLARGTAEAMADGNIDRVLELQKTFLTERDKAAEVAKANASDRRPPAGQEEPGASMYTKLADEAAAQGDYSAQAYYLRLAQQTK